jgi:hypothetical protein
MLVATVSLLAVTLAANASWSMLVTRTGHVAVRRPLTDSILQGVQAQPDCPLGAYIPPSDWKVPLDENADLAECRTSACLESLARRGGIDRLIALRLNQGFETILVQASVLEVASGALTEFEVTEVAEDAVEANGRRVAASICARLPQRVLATLSGTLAASPTANASHPSPRRRGAGPLVAGGFAASALVASGVFMALGARQTQIVRDTKLPTLEERQAAHNFGKAMNTGAYTSLGVSLLAAGVGAALWFLDERDLHFTVQALPGEGAGVTIQGEF